jgi:chromosome partitioning protein
VSGIALTMFDSQTKLSNEVVAELHGFIEAAQGKPLPWADAKVFKTRIRRNIKLAESPSFGQHILKYDPASNGAADYRALAREVLGMSEPAKAQPAATDARVSAPPAPPAPPAAPAPRSPLSVTLNPGIDPSRLTAAKVSPSAAPVPGQADAEAVA